jgi:hypothetical protein
MTVMLSALRPIARNTPSTLTYPALVIGSLLPSALFVFLRRLGHRREVSLLLSAIVVVAPVPVGFSARVKPYVFEPLVMIGVATVVHLLARRRWDRRVALAWVLGAALVSTFSIFSLVMCAVAGVILWLHPAGDRTVRTSAIAVHGVVVGSFLLASRTRYNGAWLQDFWEAHGHLFTDVRATPFHIVGELWRHLVDIAGVYPGGPAWCGPLVVAAMLFGLGIGAVRQRDIVAQFFLLILAVAAVGSMTRQFPFGASEFVVGGRLALWLLPLIAYGLANAVTFLTTVPLRVDVPQLRWLVVVAAIAVVAFNVGEAPKYPIDGSHEASLALERQLGPHDVALLMPASAFPLAIESNFHSRVVSSTTSENGLRVVFTGRNIYEPFFLGREATERAIRTHIDGADRVFVFYGFIVTSKERTELVRRTLQDAGYAPAGGQRYGLALIQTWTRTTASNPTG